MFIIVYAKIVDAKKKGITLQGPFLGPECHSMDEAHTEAKAVVSSNKDMILIRIYSLAEYSYEDAKVVAMSGFKTTYENMLAAASIIEKPSFKSSKKHRKLTTIVWDDDDDIDPVGAAQATNVPVPAIAEESNEPI